MAIEAIKKYCPNFRNGLIMSIDDVDEKPKFIYKWKEYFLFEDDKINPEYVGFLTRELKKCNVLFEKTIGRTVALQFRIGNSDALNLKIVNVTGEREDAKIIKKAIIFAFTNTFIYISAKNNGVKVDLWEKWALPLGF